MAITTGKTTKTAISVPVDVFECVTHHVEVTGMSRSEFFTRAARRYLEEFEIETMTDHINAALDVQGEESAESNRVAVAVGRRFLAGTEGDW